MADPMGVSYRQDWFWMWMDAELDDFLAEKKFAAKNVYRISRKWCRDEEEDVLMKEEAKKVRSGAQLAKCSMVV